MDSYFPIFYILSIEYWTNRPFYFDNLALKLYCKVVRGKRKFWKSESFRPSFLSPRWRKCWKYQKFFLWSFDRMLSLYNGGDDIIDINGVLDLLESWKDHSLIFCQDCQVISEIGSQEIPQDEMIFCTNCNKELVPNNVINGGHMIEDEREDGLGAWFLNEAKQNQNSFNSSNSHQTQLFNPNIRL